MSYILYVVSKSVLQETIFSVKKYLIDSLSVLFEVPITAETLEGPAATQYQGCSLEGPGKIEQTPGGNNPAFKKNNVTECVS